MKQLNDKELSKITNNDLEFNLAEANVRAARLEIKIIEQQMKLISYEMEKKRQNLDTLMRRESQARDQRADMLKTIAKKKGLSPGWGFNPDSGEIIEGEV